MKKAALIISIMIASQLTSIADWEIWISPPKRVFRPKEQFEVVYGISGVAHLKPDKVKFMVYAEKDTLLRSDENASECHEIFAMFLRTNVNPNVFGEAADRVPIGENQNLVLKCEYSSPFNPLFVEPTTPGDKSLTFILTYRTESGQWQTKTSSFSYHVLTAYERNQVWMQWVAVVAAIAGIWANALRNTRITAMANKRWEAIRNRLRQFLKRQH